jgi:hypothetical protein
VLWLLSFCFFFRLISTETLIFFQTHSGEKFELDVHNISKQLNAVFHQMQRELGCRLNSRRLCLPLLIPFLRLFIFNSSFSSPALSSFYLFSFLVSSSLIFALPFLSFSPYPFPFLFLTLNLSILSLLYFSHLVTKLLLLRVVYFKTLSVPCTIYTRMEGL